jgi:hypothetical protein
VSNQSHHPIVTYNADRRNDSSEPITLGRRADNPAVNEFVNGRDDPRAESRWNSPNSGQIPPKNTNHRTEYALGARDRQFKSGHPDFYFHSSKRIIFQPTSGTRPRSFTVNEM